ncbi:MAG: YjfB family protein [Methylococcaceae bacterium]|nr:YjfB family protein [Methylococcaceae bacterium]
MDAISGIMNTAVAVQQNKAATQLNVAILNKAQDVQKQQGEAVLQLLSSVPSNPRGIDVYA